MNNIKIGTRTFLARASQGVSRPAKGQPQQTTPAVLVCKDAVSPLADDTITINTKYAVGPDKVERTTVSLREEEVVVIDGVATKPHGGGTLRFEGIFDRDTPYAKRLEYLNNFKELLNDAQVIAAIANAQPLI